MGFKNSLSKILILLGVVSLIAGNIISFGKNISYAEDLVLVGENTGLVIIPESTRLFDLTNMSPGSTYEANLTIENNYRAPFELFMRTQRISAIPAEGEPDLFSQILLTVYLDNRELYYGSMAEFALSNISLGGFEPKDRENLKAVVHLPGRETTNEFQGKSLDVEWIFTAWDRGGNPDDDHKPKEPDKPKPPRTGDTIPMGFYGLGLGLLGLGISAKLKKGE